MPKVEEISLVDSLAHAIASYCGSEDENAWRVFRTEAHEILASMKNPTKRMREIVKNKDPENAARALAGYRAYLDAALEEQGWE